MSEQRLPIRNVLSRAEILAGYDAVSTLYPFLPHMMIWRSWEYAGYQRYRLTEPVLDVGCGDGNFFRLVWPTTRKAVGIDQEPAAVEAARRSGTYERVYLAAAQQLALDEDGFSSAFANCSLEHMDDLPRVLKSINRSMVTGGGFLLSVVTDKLIEWASLPLLVKTLGEPERARTLQFEYEEFHHYVSALPPETWIKRLEEAGFEVLEHIPILPEVTTRLFLFLDHLWHVRDAAGEVGDAMHRYLMSLGKFTPAFREVLSGVLLAEENWTTGSGVIFWARKKA